MRELNSEEIDRVAGGFAGAKIPFFNEFISGESMRGKPAGAVGAIVTGFSIGYKIGEGINRFNREVSGMSLGTALYRTFNGGSRLGSSGGGRTLIPLVTVEEI